MRTHPFLMSHEELFAEGPKRIATFMDGLTGDESKAAVNFIQKLANEGKIENQGFRFSKGKDTFTIGYTLHECLQRYPHGGSGIPVEKQVETGTTAEYIRLFTADELWVFDRGDNYPYGGRLDNRVKTMMMPIRFLCRTDDGSWDFYRGMDIVIDEENDETREDWFLIGEEEPYIPAAEESIAPKDEPRNKFCRPFSKECMSEREYSITHRAFLVSVRTSALTVSAMVKRDDELDKKANKLMGKGNTIFFKMQSEVTLTDEMLQTFEAQLDFIEAEIEELF